MRVRPDINHAAPAARASETWRELFKLVWEVVPLLCPRYGAEMAKQRMSLFTQIRSPSSAVEVACVLTSSRVTRPSSLLSGPGAVLGDEVLAGVGAGGLEARQELGAEADHPRAAVLERERREGDDELVQVVAGVEDLHGGPDGGLAVVDEDEVGVAHVLQVELDDLVGAVHLAILEVAAHGVEEDEVLAQELFGGRAPGAGLAGVRVHDRPAQVNLLLDRFVFHGRLRGFCLFAGGAEPTLPPDIFQEEAL